MPAGKGEYGDEGTGDGADEDFLCRPGLFLQPDGEEDGGESVQEERIRRCRQGWRFPQRRRRLGAENRQGRGEFDVTGS